MNINDLNPNLLKAHYAVRGKIVSRAQKLEKEGKKIIYCKVVFFTDCCAVFS